MKINFDKDQGVLSCNGQAKKIGHRDSLVLDALLSKKGRVLSKKFLLEQAWSDTVVTEVSLIKSIHSLRCAFDCLLPSKNVILTVPKVGYTIKEDLIFEYSNNSKNHEQRLYLVNSHSLLFLSIIFFISLFFFIYVDSKDGSDYNEMKSYRLDSGNNVYSTFKVDSQKKKVLSEINCNCEIFFSPEYISIYLPYNNQGKSINFIYTDGDLYNIINKINIAISKKVS